MSSLEANQRLNKTKGSNNLLRKQGLVPCIVYGGKEENELISISKKHLKSLIDKENFLSNVLKIKINEKEISVLPREVSFDVVKNGSWKKNSSRNTSKIHQSRKVTWSKKRGCFKYSKT